MKDKSKNNTTNAIQKLSDSSGSALLVTLLVMVAVTILGIMSIHVSSVEINIAHNEREIRESFYLAEGAAMEGIQRLIDTTGIDLDEQIEFWHHSFEKVHADGIDFRDPDQWIAEGGDEDNALQSPMGPETLITAVEWRVATGGSLIQTDSRLYHNRIYGLSTKHNADNMVEIGYYMRY